MKLSIWINDRDSFIGPYLNQDAATSADSQNRFFAGEVALFPNSSFGVKDAQDVLGVDNVGAILPPAISADAKITNSTIGGPGQSLQKRKSEYQEITRRNGTTMDAVEALAGKKAIRLTPAGQYVRLPSGKWVKK